MSQGLSSEKSRSQWKAENQKLVFAVMTKCTSSTDWINIGFGCALIAQIVDICDREDEQQAAFLSYLETNLIKK